MGEVFVCSRCGCAYPPDLLSTHLVEAPSALVNHLATSPWPDSRLYQSAVPICGICAKQLLEWVEHRAFDRLPIDASERLRQDAIAYQFSCGDNVR